jgi:hypothetical protein
MWTIIAVSLALMAPDDNAIDRASRMAETFWKQYTAVQCKERIVQTKLKPDGKIIESHFEDFDYVGILKLTGGGLTVEESRVARPSFPETVRGPLLTTTGFPTFLLMFHPDVRNKFEFAEIPANNGDGLRRIAFKSRPETPSMSALKLKDHLYPIFWKGTATLDAKSGSIRKIEATLDAPMEDLGLSDLQVEVDYAPVAFTGDAEVSWLPARAVIALKTPRQMWRNVHEFSNYKRFSTTTSTIETEPK